MRVLFLTHRLPYAPNRGDRVRAYHLLKALQGRAAVDLVSLVHSDEEASQQVAAAELVENLEVCRVPAAWNYIKGAVLLGTTRTLTHVLLDSPVVKQALSRVIRRSRPDVVLAYCSSMGRFALEPPLSGTPFVVDMVDVDSVKWRDIATRARPPLKWIYAREARLLGRFEATLALRAFSTTVITNHEAKALTLLAPRARIVVAPNGIDVARLHPNGGPVESQDVVFCGVMNYTPNEHAAIWMTRHVWPAVHARRPGARLLLVGSEPSGKVKALADPAAGVEVTGTVSDVRPYLWNAAISVAPLQTARGTQNKVLEAVACGLPCVVTRVVAEGLPDQVLGACRVAGTPREFADAIVSLLEMSPADRRAVVEHAAPSELSWDRSLAPLIDQLEQAARNPPSMSAQFFTLPTSSDLDQLFRQKYGDPATVGWSPRRRYQFGYYLPADVYEATVNNLVSEGCAWIDIGGGHNIFPENPALARTLANRCQSVVAVDPSENVQKNTFATERVQCLIEDYQTDQRFDLATLRMVVEHVADPPSVSAALAKLLRPGGVLVVLTVNKRSPLTLVSRLVPFHLHYPIKRLFWGSAAEDTFEVEYKMNSRRALGEFFGGAGLDEVLFAYLDDLSTWSRFRRMSYVESLARMMFNRVGLAYPENCLLAVYRKR